MLVTDDYLNSMPAMHHPKGYATLFPSLSSVHRNQIIDLAAYTDAHIYDRGWRMLKQLAVGFKNEELARIEALLQSGRLDSDKMQLACEILIKAGYKLGPKSIDAFIGQITNKYGHFTVPTVMKLLSYFTKIMEPEQEERVLKAISKIKGNFSYFSILDQKEDHTLNSYGNSSFCPIPEESIKNHITKILGFLNNPSGFQQKAGTELLISMGDNLPKKCVGEIITLLSGSDANVVINVLYSLFLIPQKLDNSDLAIIIDCLSNEFDNVRRAATYCLVKLANAKNNILNDHIPRLESLLDSKVDDIACLTMTILGEIPDKVSEGALEKIIAAMEKWEDIIRYYPQQVARFANRFSSEHFGEIVDYIKKGKPSLKASGIDILAEIERLELVCSVPDDAVSEVIEYLKSNDKELMDVIAKFIENVSPRLLKEHVRRMVEIYENNPNNWMLDRLSKIPPKRLAEHIDLFINLLNSQESDTQVKSLDILAYLRNELQPHHIKQVEKFFQSSNHFNQERAYNVLKEIYESRGLSQ